MPFIALQAITILSLLCIIVDANVHIEPLMYPLPNSKFKSQGVDYFQYGSNVTILCNSNFDTDEFLQLEQPGGWEKAPPQIKAPWTIYNLLKPFNVKCCDESPGQIATLDFAKCPRRNLNVAPQIWVRRPAEAQGHTVTNITEGEPLEFACWAPNIEDLFLKMKIRGGDFLKPDKRSHTFTNSSGQYFLYNSSVEGSGPNEFYCEVQLRSRYASSSQIYLTASNFKPRNETTDSPPVKPGLPLKTKILIFLASLTIFLIGCSVVAFVFYRRQPEFSNIDRSSSLDELLSPYVPVKIGEIVNVCPIERGHFGAVYKYKLKFNNEEYFVAKKELLSRNPDEIDELRRELDTLKKIPRHPNILKLLAAVRDENGVVCIVTELCDTSLKKELNKIREELLQNEEINAEQRLSQIKEKVADLVCCALQICNGMKHLHIKREPFGACVHRDLAARNVLLKDGIPVISDFGLSRHVKDPYYFLTRGPIPVVTYAPECLIGFREESIIKNNRRREKYDHTIFGDSRYSTASDVWSFGILLYEMFSFGEDPIIAYRSQGANPHSPDSLLEFLEQQRRLTKPEFCPHEIYQIMQNCWKYVSRERPTFVELEVQFTEMLPRYYSDGVNLYKIYARINQQMDDFFAKVAVAEETQEKWNRLISSASRVARNEEAAQHYLRQLDSDTSSENSPSSSRNGEALHELELNELQRASRNFGLFDDSQAVVVQNDQYLVADNNRIV